MDKLFNNLPIRKFASDNPNKFFLGILLISIILGVLAGYMLSNSENKSAAVQSTEEKTAKTPEQDNRTFRDFAEGTIKKRPDPKNAGEYIEGTHLLIRDIGTPVALTSSVVDLNQYENKKVKIFGETQKGVKEEWLMDVGKVEEK